jgi:hypothetical protein
MKKLSPLQKAIRESVLRAKLKIRKFLELTLEIETRVTV